MSLTRRAFAALGAAALLPLPAVAQEVLSDDPLYLLQRNLLWGNPAEFREALDIIAERGSTDMAAGLIQGLRFARDDGYARGIVEVLQGITGESHEDWFDWMLWQQAHPEAVPHPSFITFKREVMTAIDSNFDIFLRPEHLDPDQMGIRLEEITWGGVYKDGIPALTNPILMTADEAEYLRDDDLVFGVSINGDARAYPLRIMGWHEMFNDVVGGVPVSLAYCTLCGSGILFRTDVDVNEPLIFGSSGFLYRSNKLMYDQRTHSLWNQFTGRPVVGPLAGTDMELEVLPVVITSWGNWKRDNPDTKALSLETGFQRDYGSGVVYNEYFASPDLMFPVAVDQSRFAQKDYVFTIRQFGAAKAWPLEAFEGRRGGIINDAVGDQSVVLIAEPMTRQVRAYERNGYRFESRMDGLTAGNQLWTITEDALISSNGEQLPRVAGHIAYWFAWDGYFGDEAELYEEG